MKKIILPTDFSENAYNAIKYAVQLFKDIETTFYLLHTYTPPIFQVEYLFYSPSQVGLGDPYQERAMNHLKDLQQRLEEEFRNPEHTFITRAVFNTLIDEVHKITDYEKADLVIMGTQGATGAKEILFGSNTTQVIGKATCSVIAVPSNYGYNSPKEILFPTDYEIDFEKSQLQKLLDLTQNHNSTIEAIHISSGYDLSAEQIRNKQKLHECLDGTTHFFHDLPDQGVIEAINQFQVKKEMNLLVMVRNKHTFFDRLFIEPVIKKIGFHVNIPFMVIPHEE